MSTVTIIIPKLLKSSQLTRIIVKVFKGHINIYGPYKALKYLTETELTHSQVRGYVWQNQERKIRQLTLVSSVRFRPIAKGILNNLNLILYQKLKESILITYTKRVHRVKLFLKELRNGTQLPFFGLMCHYLLSKPCTITKMTGWWINSVNIENISWNCILEFQL